MAHRRTEIVDDLVAALEIQGLQVERGRIELVGVDELPLVNVRQGAELVDEEDDQLGADAVNQARELEIVIEVWTTLASSSDLDTDVDVVALEVERALGPLSAASFDRLRYAGSVEPDREALDEQLVGRELRYVAEFVVDVTDPL